MSQAAYYDGYDDGVQDTLRKTKATGGGSGGGSTPEQTREPALFRLGTCVDETAGINVSGQIIVPLVQALDLTHIEQPAEFSSYAEQIGYELDGTDRFLALATPSDGWKTNDCILMHLTGTDDFKYWIVLEGGIFIEATEFYSPDQGVTSLYQYNGTSWSKIGFFIV